MRPFERRSFYGLLSGYIGVNDARLLQDGPRSYHSPISSVRYWRLVDYLLFTERVRLFATRSITSRRTFEV